MISHKTKKSSILLAVLIVTVMSAPIIQVGAESNMLYYINFFIEPSRPEILAQDSFVLNSNNDFIYGIPDGVGSRSDSRTYFLEMTSTARVEIFLLDASGFYSDFQEYVDNYVGSQPTIYTYHWICDGYFSVSFTNITLVPRMVLYSNNTNAQGEFLFTEGLDYVIYEPYHLKIVGTDRTTNDTLRVFDVNATVSAFIMDDDQYTAYLINPNTRPLSINTITSETDSLDITLNFNAEAGADYHILIWHEEFSGGVNATMEYLYQYDRPFFETYWSLFLVILLIAIIAVFFAFQKVILPPIVWSLHKLKYYVLSIPWKYIKKTGGELKDELGCIWTKMRGIQHDDDFVEKVSSHNRTLILFQALIGFIGLHRYMVRKIGTGIVFTCTLGFLGIGYLIDLIAVATGCFKDSEGLPVKSWVKKSE